MNALHAANPALTLDGALFELLTHLGDNSLILGQRLSAWCGHGPALEEDIALANVALDLIGQTQLWLELAGDVEGQGRSADALAYHRDAFDFRNAHLVEQPNGDFGQTLMRQFLFDAWHLPLLLALTKSPDNRIADIAEKISKEVRYHLERSSDLVIRLGDGSEESHRRMQRALDALMPHAYELLQITDGDALLISEGVIGDITSVAAQWEEQVNSVLALATLSRPSTPAAPGGGRRGRHTEHLGYLLADLQFLQRAYPDATW